MTVNANGSLVYSPATHYTGQNSFTYTIPDGVATATVTVEVTNFAPWAGNDSYSILHDR